MLNVIQVYVVVEWMNKLLCYFILFHVQMERILALKLLSPRFIEVLSKTVQLLDSLIAGLTQETQVCGMGKVLPHPILLPPSLPPSLSLSLCATTPTPNCSQSNLAIHCLH